MNKRKIQVSPNPQACKLLSSEGRYMKCCAKKRKG
jgi:hypothetical protein